MNEINAADRDMPDGMREALAFALDVDHPEGKCDRSCDIDVARAEGFLLAAAWLLDGATETPTLDAWRKRYQVTRDLSWWQDGAGGWIEFHREHGKACQGCGGFTYGDGDTTPEVCGHCLAPLDAPVLPEWEQDLLESGRESDLMAGTGGVHAAAPRLGADQ
jgi:hypothetical protein